MFERLLALLGAPLEKARLIHTAEVRVGVAVVGIGVARKHMVYERRGSPAESQHHVDIRTEYACLRDHPVLDVARSVLEVIGNQIRIVDGVIKSVICVADGFVGCVETELVDHRHPIVVTVVGTCRVDIVAAQVHRYHEGDIYVASVLACDIPQEALVCCDKRSLRILVGLIEGLRGYCTLLGNLQTVGVAAREQTCCGKSRYRSYKFDFHIHVLFRM